MIAVLFLAAMLTLLLYAYLREAQVEAALANGYGREKQAECLAWSAIEKGGAALISDGSPVPSELSSWIDNPTEFYEIEAGDGVFSLYKAPEASDGSAPIKWGASDEASRINLNTATREMLMKLTGMTEEIADSIIDWRDEDETVTGSGAENAHYQALQPGYSCKNGPFDTVEELLLVKGVTPELLYGEDLNQNGVLEDNENDGDKNPPVDDSDGTLNKGWLPMVTVFSYDKNVRNDGEKRININTATPQDLQAALGDVLNNQDLQRMQLRRIQFRPPTYPEAGMYPSIAHLMDVPGISPGGISVQKWKAICDRVTVTDDEALPGRINILLAPREVMMLLPGLTEEEVTAVINYRTSPEADLSNIGWLADVLPPPKIQGIANHVTVRSWQLRFDAVGRVGPKSTLDETAKITVERDSEAVPPARPMKRFHAVWDAAAETPRLLWWKDMTRLGMPYSIQE